MMGCGSFAQAQQANTQLPPVEITSPQKKPLPPKRRAANATSAVSRRRAARSEQSSTPVVQANSGENLGNGRSSGDAGPALQQTPALGKTGTRLADLPATVQIIPRAILNQQGATTLNDALYNASGINQGGQDSLGYFDHFLIRGLNAQIYSDGFSDGDQLGGISHSLNGVKQVEILSGPGSALFGSGPPGGTINIVHYDPSSVFHFGSSLQGGSFGTITNSNYITGPSTISGLNYRIDSTFSHSDGFRELGSEDFEVRPEFTWHIQDHTLNFTLDARHLHQTPDSYGLIYFHGTPITGVPTDAKYSTPFAFANQDFIRPTITDRWEVNDVLTINNRFSYLHRELDADRNGDSTKTAVNLTTPAVTGRQLRQQNDRDNSYDYQFEPVWKFGTGSIGHTLLTGFEVLHQDTRTERTTADLPNITNAFAPMPPEMSLAGLKFQCDAQHSCDNDKLSSTYYSAYATDQIDLTERWKLRAGVRQDWFDTALTPLTSVPGRFDNEGQLLTAGTTYSRHDAPVSWSVGTLYKLLPGVSPYVGVSKSYLSNFNSENTQNGIGAPESALQYEAGIKFSLFEDRVVLNTAVFDVSRDNVATPATIAGVESVVFDSQRTKGFEGSIDTKLTVQWHLLANGTIQDAVITDNPQGITAIGNHPQGVPATMANLWTTYDFSINGVHGFQIGAGLNYRDKTYSDTTNLNYAPAFVVGNLSLSYEETNWGVALNVKNFTNERYFIAANAAGAYQGEGLGAFVNVHYRQ